MEKTLIEIFNLLAIAAIISSPFLRTKGRAILVPSVISIQVILITITAFSVFANGNIDYSYDGSFTTGNIPVRVDKLSAWFLLVISFTFFTGAWYGVQYFKKCKDQTDKLAMHGVAFLLVYTALIDICMLQNGMVFLVIWEIMALSSFILIIFESNKTETIKAGINFLIQSHIAILFLTIAFMWVKIKTGSFDFSAIATYTSAQPAVTSIGLFVFFFIGFAIKAGFVPFHTWLPLAHPAAPAHVSGIMSGVIIKIGIYGMLRMLLLIKTDMVSIGYFILVISVLSGVYGVMLAIVQHNLKKLLAYHSIENIGIIGIGIGLGCLGIGHNNQMLILCGFGGALLHTLNHSLFKSLLFFTAGNVYQSTHTMNIEALGGLLRKIPNTGYLFLIGSLAICGLPPFNGFVSEFFIYSGLFHGLVSNNFLFTILLLFAILGLVLIGGLALICFTKAFGIVFLGTPRKKPHDISFDEHPANMFPLYLIAAMMLLIGIFPVLLNPYLQGIAQLYMTLDMNQTSIPATGIFNTLTIVGWYSLGFLALTAGLYFVRHLVAARRSAETDATWGCGFTGNASKMQYSASSFVRSYRKLAESVLDIEKHKTLATGQYPGKINQVTHSHDKIEKYMIDKPLVFVERFLNRFTFLQNGNIQAYILYGVVFVTLAILIPLFIDKIAVVVNFLNQL